MSTPIPFDERNTNLLIKFVPVKDKDKLTITWYIPYC